nr:TSUP family transporter [bacterium]
MEFSLTKAAILGGLCFLAAVIDSIAGGGGLISLPAYLSLGFPAHIAAGSNKFSAMWGTLIACIRYGRNKAVLWLSALVAAAGALVGSFGGAKLALFLDDKTLKYVMLGVLPLVAIFVLWKKPGIKEGKKQMKGVALVLTSAIIGLVVGAYDGLVGPGTGTFLVILFTALCGLDMLTATGNAKVVNLASNIAAMAAFSFSGKIDLRYAIPAAVCSVLGGWLGSGLAIKKGGKIIRPMLIVVLVLLFAKIIYDLFF